MVVNREQRTEGKEHRTENRQLRSKKTGQRDNRQSIGNIGLEIENREHRIKDRRG